ncbi:MAG: MoaD/ThiS family protein [Actinomycetota bacterium]|nr:MoaD/ThiS family protein [Actinomycetota bacterium]
MVKLLFFASLREIVGSRSIEVPVDDLDEIIRQLIFDYGSEFEAQLKTSRIWIDGNEASQEQILKDGCEVAFLPPVSGGCKNSHRYQIDVARS